MLFLGNLGFCTLLVIAFGVLPQVVHAQNPPSASPDTLFAQNRFVEARAAYADAVQRDPGSLASRIGLIRSLLRLDQWQEAVREGEASVKQFTQSADARGLYALALLRGGQPDTAAAEARRALTRDRFSYWALIASGRVALWNEQSGEAQRLFRLATTLRPREPEAWHGLWSASDENTPEEEKAARTYLKLAPQGHPHRERTESLALFLADRDAYKRAFEKDPSFQALAPVSESTLQRFERNGGKFEIAIAFERKDGFIILPVQIGGKALRLLFDTGGDHISLTRDAARQLKLPAVYHSVAHGVGGKESSTIVKAKKIVLGGFTLGSVPITVVGEKKQSTDGVFGAGIFKDYIVTLDLRRNRMTLTRGKEVAAPTAGAAPAEMTLPFHMLYGLILLPYRIEDKPVWAILDTGASDHFLSLRLAGELAAGLAKEKVKTGFKEIEEGTGNTERRVEYIDFEKPIALRFSQDGSGFEITASGGVGISALDRQVSRLLDFEIGVLIGMPMVNQFPRVIIDYPRRQLTLEWAPPAAAKP